MGLRKTLARLFGPMPRLSDHEVLADAAESHDKAKQRAQLPPIAQEGAKLVESVKGLGEDMAALRAEVALQRKAGGPLIPPWATDEQIAEHIRADSDAYIAQLKRQACPPFPPLETPSGRVPLDWGDLSGNRLDRIERAAKEALDAGLHPFDAEHDAQWCELAGRYAVSPTDLMHAVSKAADSATLTTEQAMANVRALAGDATLADAIKGWKAGDSITGLGDEVTARPTDWTKPLGVAFPSVRDATPEETAAMEHRVIAHRVESEAERRTRLLAEWTAHREADPMAAGRVPGEPMPRTEAELIGQAFLLLARRLPAEEHLPHVDDMRLYFSLALTYLHLERAPAYEEHDGNRIVVSILRSARGRAT